MTHAVTSVSASIHISRPIDVVCRQFADVEHHAKSRVHDGVEFTPLMMSAKECRFRKTVHVLGIPLADEVLLKREADGELTEEFVSGSNVGTRLTSRFYTEGQEATKVEVTVELSLRGLRRLAAPLLRRLVLKRLTKALDEDRRDLEERGYD